MHHFENRKFLKIDFYILLIFRSFLCQKKRKFFYEKFMPCGNPAKSIFKNSLKDCIKILKELLTFKNLLKIFNIESSNQTIRKHVWWFG